MKALAQLVLISVAVVSGNAQTHWKHQRLLSESPAPVAFGNGGAYVNAAGVAAYTSDDMVYKGATRYDDGSLGWVGGLNDLGQMAWRSHGHVFVEHSDISAGTVTDGDQHQVYVYGVSDAGVPFWSMDWAPAVQKEFEMYVGSTSLNVGALLGAHRSYELTPAHKVLSRAGVPVWSGGGDATGQHLRAFRGAADISSPILGPNSRGEAIAINDAGQVVWNGSYSSSNPQHVYLDAQDITSSVLGPSGGGYARGVNSWGQVLWEGTTSKFQSHAFLDDTDYTARAYGSTPARAFAQQVTDSGHILWLGNADNDYQDVFADQSNLSKSVLGGHRIIYNQCIDEAGHVAWDGYGDLMPYNNVFVDQFDLTADALGTSTRDCIVLAMGPSGNVLWIAQDPKTQLYDFWLSTPVPEPTGLALGLLVVSGMALRLRGKRSARPR